MGRRALLLVVIVSVVAAGVGAFAGVFTDKPLSERDGFAVWPEDTLAEAEEECAGGESWRTSVEETVVRFARRLGIGGKIKVSGVGYSDEAEEEGGVSITGPEIPLEHGLGVREEFGCWYVTHIRNREDFDPPDWTGYAGLPPNRIMFVYMPTFGTVFDGTTLRGSLGSGLAERSFDDIVREPPATYLSVPANEELPGHFMYASTGSGNESPGEPYATVEAAPPDISGAVEVPDATAVKEAFDEDAADGKCRGWYRAGYKPELAARFSLSRIKNYADVEKPTLVRPQANGDYVVEVTGTKFAVDRWLTNGCDALGIVRPVEETEEAVEGIRVNEGGIFFDLEWGDATEAFIEFGFGGRGDDMSLGPVPNPVSFAQDFPMHRPGEYRVGFWNEDGLLAAYEGALPPLVWLKENDRE